MLEYTPVHIAYARPFMQKAELSETKADVSADRAEEVVEFNFRMDLSHLMMVNMLMNIVLILLVLSLLRK